jgi:hypothetical protein
MSDDYTMPFEIPTMEIKLNNLCNLKCRMCHPMDSTSWNDWDEIEEFNIKEDNIVVGLVEKHNLKSKPYLDKFEDNPNWWTSFEKLLPYFRRVEFAGGEPLLDPQHYRILDMLIPYGHQLEICWVKILERFGNIGQNLNQWQLTYLSMDTTKAMNIYAATHHGLTLLITLSKCKLFLI